MLMRKMFRDIRSNAGQFISIVLLSALTLLMFTSFKSSDIGAVTAMDKFFKECNQGKGWIYGENLSDDQLEEIEQLSGVKEAQFRTRLKGEIADQGKAELDLFLEDENLVSRPKVIEGKQIDLNDKDAIWISEKFAKIWGLKPGDEFKYEINGETINKKIAGLIALPEYIYIKADKDVETNLKNLVYAVTAKKGHPNHEYIPNTEIIFTSDIEDVMSLERSIKDKLDGKYSVFIDKKSIPGIQRFLDEIEQHEQFSFVFSAIFVLITMLVIITTMKRIVEQQRTQIGILNALGMKRRKIEWHYISYSFFSSTVGGIIGAILGVEVVGKLYTYTFAQFYTLPGWGIGTDKTFVICLLIVVAICISSSYLSCRKLLKVEPAEALRPASPKTGKRSIFEKLSFWDRLSFSMQYNLRDVSRYKLRALMGVLGTMFGMMFMVCAFSCFTTIDKTVDWNFNKIAKYNSEANFEKNISIGEAERLAKKYDGELLMNAKIELAKTKDAAFDEKKEGVLLVHENKGLVNATNKKLEIEKIPEGTVSVSMKIADRLGIKVGDTVYWHLYDKDKWVKSKVGMINRNPTTYGITMDRADFESLDEYKYKPNELVSMKKINKTESGYITSAHTKKEIMKAFNETMEIINVMFAILLTFSSIFVLIVLYNSGKLSFNERIREFATLKVCGLSSKKIRKILSQQNFIISVIGVATGAPLGKMMLQYMFDSNGDAWDYQVFVSARDYIASGACVLIIAILVSFMFSRKIKNLDMVTTLKGME